MRTVILSILMRHVRISYLPKVMHLASGRAGIWTQFCCTPKPRRLTLYYYTSLSQVIYSGHFSVTSSFKSSLTTQPLKLQWGKEKRCFPSVFPAYMPFREYRTSMSSTHVFLVAEGQVITAFHYCPWPRLSWHTVFPGCDLGSWSSTHLKPQ